MRVEWIDRVKYICIIFVIISHLESGGEFLRAFFIPFFLNAFLFASGYVYCDNNQTFLEIFKKKIQQLFFPWLVFSVLNIILSQIITFNDHVDLITELRWNFLQIHGLGDGLWFIAALFVSYIPFYFIIHSFKYGKLGTLKRKITWLFLLSFLLSFVSVLYVKVVPADIYPWRTTNNLPWHLEYVFQAMFYMVCGYLFRMKYETTFDKINTRRVRVFLFISYSALVFVSKVLEFSLILEIIYSYLCECVGVMLIVVLMKSVKGNRYIMYIGQNTLLCFAFHGKVLSLLQLLIKKVCSSPYEYILNNELFSSIFAIMFSLLITVILTVPIYFVDKYLPFLVGRQKKKIN